MRKILAKSLEFFSRGLLIGSVLFLSFNTLTAQSIAINEVMASNASTVADENGDYEDWIELYNFGPEQISLNGYGLSDDSDNPFRWVFPAISIQPGEFLLIWASGKNRTDPALPLHTNFSISTTGEEILLTSADSFIIDEVVPIAIPTDITYGRHPDGTGDWFFFDEPTPGESNSNNTYSEILEPPIFSHPAGFYSEPFELLLTHPDPEVTIIYSLDGSEPSNLNLSGTVFSFKNQYPEFPGNDFGELLYGSYHSSAYNEPLSIADRSEDSNSITHIATTWNYEQYYFPDEPVFKGSVVRAVALKEGAINSEIKSASYFVSGEGRDRYSLPVMSIHACKLDLFDYEDGIYVAGIDYDNWRWQNPDAQHDWETAANFHRSGTGTEIPVNLELFEVHNPLASISQEVGIRLHGGESRRRPMKSLRLYARNEYGQNTLDHKFFDALNDTSFKRLLLRNSGQDFPHTMMRDAIIQRVLSHLYIDTQEFTPVVLFINGEYWGLHNLRERYDKFYFNRVYNVDPENIDHLSNYMEINEGDSIHYQLTLHYIEENGLTEDEHYEYIQTRIDVRNFRDYQIANIFAGNTDWPGNNMEYWRVRTSEYQPDAPYGHDGRWRWMLYDMDYAFGLFGGSDAAMNNTLAFATEPGGTNWPNPDWSTFLLRKFLENEEFKTGFINRFADLLNTSLLPDHITNIISETQNKIQPEMQEHILRWKTPYGITDWQASVNILHEFANARPSYQRQHINDYFELEGQYNLEVNVSNLWHGRIKINTIEIKDGTPGVMANPYPWTGIYFLGIPVEVEAIPARGYAFSHWEGLPYGSQASIMLQPDDDISITAHFVRVNVAELMYYWLFDDQLPNDTPLSEVSASYQVAGSGVLRYSSSLDGYPFDPTHPNWHKASLERRNAPTSINYRPEGNNEILFNEANMRGLQVKQPFSGDGGENTIVFQLPTVNHEELIFRFAAKDEGAAEYLVIDYSIIPGDEQWISEGIDTLHMLSPDYQIYEIDFTSISGSNDNPDFKVRIRFGGSNMAADDGNRVTFNNFSLDGKPLAGINLPPIVENPIGFQELIEFGEDFKINLNLVYQDPDNDPLVFEAGAENSQMVELSIENNWLTISPLNRGGTIITLTANDGLNDPVAISFRILIYPEAFRFGEENFSFTGWDSDEPEYSYPENMLFLQSDINDPGLDHPLLYPYFIAHDDYHADDQGTIGFPYNNTGRTRLNGLGEEGISFINTGRGCDLGGALLAINTRGITSASLNWLAGTLLENSRVYGLRLQYRTDINESFSDLLINGVPLEYLTATNGDIMRFQSILLPAEILDQEYVQLLWRYYYVGGDSGPRAQLRLDDIIFSEVIGIPAIDEEILNIYSHGNSIFIELPGNIESVLHVYDLAGRLVQNQRLSGQNKHIIQLGSQKGIYIVRLITDKQVYSRKVLVY